ncbi:MAG: hypothetical protein EA400_08930 [Chromatiaceae bacterium]|nr:MAG: hypothetical protein EA400_08930 [Chromatiaceae bacterium]
MLIGPGRLAADDDNEATRWDRYRTTAADWWQRSRAATHSAWESAWEQARAALSPAEADAFQQVWTGVLPRLEAGLALQEVRRELPERAWFRRDQTDADADLDALLGEAVALLSTSPVQQYRTRIQALQAEILRARADLDTYRRQRVAAPAESRFGRNQADYDALIARRQADIRGYQAERDAIKATFANELRGIGLALTPDQVELLLATVVGDNLVDLGIVFDNVKAITEQLERLVRESGEDLQSARRYYGMYVILLRALAHMHTEVETRIATVYLPRIDDIATRARQLSEETRALRRAQPDQAELLDANLRAQALTIEAARVYRAYLLEQQAQVAAATATLTRDIEAAWNTYETVRVSGELVDLVQSSQRLISSLIEREVPALRPFQNLEMQREFQKLTEQLRRAEG